MFDIEIAAKGLDKQDTQLATASSSLSGLTEDDLGVAEILRSIPSARITHTLMNAKMGVYRRRFNETDEALHARCNRVLEHTAALKRMTRNGLANTITNQPERIVMPAVWAYGVLENVETPVQPRHEYKY